MCNIKLKVSEGEKNVELEMVDYNEDMLKYVMDKISDVLTPTMDNEEVVEQQKDPLQTWKEGYESLKSEEQGLHDPGTEYTQASKNEEKKLEAPTSPIQTKDHSSIRTNTVNLHGEKKQLYYICECGNKGKHFIGENRKYVTCHDCSNKMKVRLADSRGSNYRDEFGNYYIAGEFKKTMQAKEEEAEFWRTFQTS